MRTAIDSLSRHRFCAKYVGVSCDDVLHDVSFGDGASGLKKAWRFYGLRDGSIEKQEWLVECAL